MPFEIQRGIISFLSPALISFPPLRYPFCIFIYLIISLKAAVLVKHNFLASSVITENLVSHVRFYVLTAASMKMTVFWDIASRSFVEFDLRFRGAYCLHCQGGEHS
jgi:hypothetical protein